MDYFIILLMISWIIAFDGVGRYGRAGKSRHIRTLSYYIPQGLQPAMPLRAFIILPYILYYFHFFLSFHLLFYASAGRVAARAASLQARDGFSR